MTAVPHAMTIVYVDKTRDRNHPIVGRQLLALLGRRVFIAAAVTTGLFSLPWVMSIPFSRTIQIWVFGFVGFSVVFLTLYGGSLLTDYQQKRELAEKYCFDRRFGLDTVQRRELRIESPPEDLPERIAHALKRITEDAEVQRVGTSRFEAKISRRGKRLSCRVVVEVLTNVDNTLTVTVESRLSELLGFGDVGQNIINVEEFQHALVGLLGVEPRSLPTAFVAESR